MSELEIIKKEIDILTKEAKENESIGYKLDSKLIGKYKKYRLQWIENNKDIPFKEGDFLIDTEKKMKYPNIYKIININFGKTDSGSINFDVLVFKKRNSWVDYKIESDTLYLLSNHQIHEGNWLQLLKANGLKILKKRDYKTEILDIIYKENAF